MTQRAQARTEHTGPEAVRDLLVEHERNLAWLARKLNVSISHIYRIVEGERPITPAVAERLAKLFDVPTETFLPAAAAEEGEE